MPAASAAPTANAQASPSVTRTTNTITEGYRDLLGGLVLPVTSADLIKGAWQGVVAEARHESIPSTQNLAPLGSDADENLAAFMTAYSVLVADGGTRLDPNRMSQAALTSMAETVGDCHTAYLTRDQWSSINSDLRGREMIPALPLTFDLAAPYLVESVVESGDAARQGVHPGDRILSFDGISLDDVPLSQRKFLTAGAAGSIVRLDLQSPGGTRHTVSVQREAVDRPLLSSKLRGSIGYIRLRTFSTNLNSLLDAALASLQSRGARGFVIDLRGNLGGELNTDVHLLSKFIASGLLATTTGRGGAQEEVSAEGSSLPGPPPLAVLVDGGSLSASELFAEDIRQYRAGELVGSSTPGCLLGSNFRQLSDGSAMQVTALKVVVGPQQSVVNGVGVRPDAPVPVTAADFLAGRDPQLDRALADVGAQLAR